MTTTKQPKTAQEIIAKSHEIGRSGIIIDGVTIWQPDTVRVKVKVGEAPEGGDRVRVYTISRTTVENPQDHSIWCASYTTDGRFKWNDRDTCSFYKTDAELDAAIKRIVRKFEQI